MESRAPRLLSHPTYSVLDMTQLPCTRFKSPWTSHPLWVHQSSLCTGVATAVCGRSGKKQGQTHVMHVAPLLMPILHCSISPHTISKTTLLRISRQRHETKHGEHLCDYMGHMLVSTAVPRAVGLHASPSSSSFTCWEGLESRNEPEASTLTQVAFARSPSPYRRVVSSGPFSPLAQLPLT